MLNLSIGAFINFQNKIPCPWSTWAKLENRVLLINKDMASSNNQKILKSSGTKLENNITVQDVIQRFNDTEGMLEHN